MPSKICTDMLSEIIVRLPVDSLVRFQGISKDFLALIRRPDVAKRYAVRTTGFLVCAADDKRENTRRRATYSYLTMPSGPAVELSGSLPPRATVCASHNGLLLLRQRIAGRLHFYIRNPVLRSGSDLPLSDHVQDHRHLAGGVVFNPRASPHYQVVEVAQHPGNKRIELQVFSSITGTWAKLERILGLREECGTVHATGVACSTAGCLCVLLISWKKFVLIVDVANGDARIVALPLQWEVGRLTMYFDQEVLQVVYIHREGLLVMSMLPTVGEKPAIATEMKRCEHEFWNSAFMAEKMMPRLVHAEGNVVSLWIGTKIAEYRVEGSEMEAWEWGKDTRGIIRYSPIIPYSVCFVNPFGAKLLSRIKRKRRVAA